MDRPDRVRRLGPLLAGVSLVLLGCAPSTAAPPAPPAETAATGFRNPVWDSNFPDPMIISAGDGTYVAFATNGNGANVQTLRSRDLLTWEQGPDALPELAEWTSPGDVWAPEVAVHAKNRYVLYYTTRAPGGEIQCISHAVASRPEGPYQDRSKEPLVCERDAGGSIDAHPFTTAAGERYLYWKNDGNRVGVDTWISVQRLDEAGTEMVGKPKRLITADQPWEGQLVEAPFVWEGGGRFTMLYSANAFASADYAAGVATSASPTGPFEKQPEPVLTTNDAAAGPGHGAILERDGTVWVVYHAWAPDAIGSEIPGRTMWLSELTFGADGSVSVVPPTTDYPTKP